MKHLQATDFPGVSGHVLFDGPNRIGKIEVIQVWPKNDSFNVVRRYQMQKDGSKNGTLEKTNESVRWLTPDGSVPTDGIPDAEVCNIERFRAQLGVSCDVAIVIANILGISGIAILMFGVIYLFKRRYDKEVRADAGSYEGTGTAAAATC
ncbi:PREDICTED: uncharacterized protein LOC106809965 [Priapulus caudatus]|uniref:Uncharacterized protein LOC106809965 n=1 Tax=Priapulus caudatus TaxID=37621 RepID=A0ABM1E921_PRICU|nr:PREDICTED: uncharacterized protein LOC106809965 [Priapulus caudatus]